MKTKNLLTIVLLFTSLLAFSQYERQINFPIKCSVRTLSPGIDEGYEPFYKEKVKRLWVWFFPCDNVPVHLIVGYGESRWNVLVYPAETDEDVVFEFRDMIIGDSTYFDN